MRDRILALFTVVAAVVCDRAAELRRNPDRGSHAVEYAIGIGLAAAVVLLLFAAYKAGVQNIINSWVFS
jgi:hypothetical protein